MKECTRCREKKDTACFYSHKGRGDGLSRICKSCDGAIGRERRAKNRARNAIPNLALSKTCRACGESKSVLSFNLDRSREGGYGSLCKSCDSQRASEWAVRNPERKRKINAAIYAANPQKQKERLRRRYEEKKEEVQLYATEWRNTNRAKVRAYQAARKRHVKRATPLWLTAIQRAQIQEFYEIAIARTMQTGTPHEVDHIYPLRGSVSSGLHVPWNLQVLTAVENSAKRIRLPEEMHA